MRTMSQPSSPIVSFSRLARASKRCTVYPVQTPLFTPQTVYRLIVRVLAIVTIFIVLLTVCIVHKRQFRMVCLNKLYQPKICLKSQGEHVAFPGGGLEASEPWVHSGLMLLAKTISWVATALHLATKFQEQSIRHFGILRALAVN